MGATEKILWSNFFVTDFFLLLYFFFLIGNPSLPQKLNDFLLLGKIFKLPSYSNQFSSNLINTSSRERGLTSGFSVFLFRSSYLENLEEFWCARGILVEFESLWGLRICHCYLLVVSRQIIHLSHCVFYVLHEPRTSGSCQNLDRYLV